MTTCCLRVVVIFGFAITQLRGKVDDDTKFLTLSFFWLQLHSMRRRGGGQCATCTSVSFLVLLQRSSAAKRMMTRYLCIVVIFGFAIVQLRDEKDNTRFLVSSFYFLLDIMPFNVKKRMTMTMRCLRIIIVLVVVAQICNIKDDDMKFPTSCFFLIAPFSAKKRRTTMVCYLCIVIVFGFSTTQFYNEEDDDMKFLALSFFQLQLQSMGKRRRQ